MSRPRLLDLYCCQGGASAGYVAAGFDVTGVDMDPQPRYPYRFVRDSALGYLFHVIETGEIGQYAAVAASPPCQGYAAARTIRGNEHPSADQLPLVRQMLAECGIPYIIENVVGAPMRDPVMLCGTMFGLRTYRHRLFESNVPLAAPPHPRHIRTAVKLGRKLSPDDFYTAVGNFHSVGIVREDMGVPWMSRDGVRESIPPAYTEHLGRQLMAFLIARAALVAS